MPKSRVRKKKSAYSPPEALAERRAVKVGPKPWVAPLMLAFFLLGLLWIVVYYLTRGDLPLMRTLGPWNLLVGFALVGAGFVTSTRWR